MTSIDSSLQPLIITPGLEPGDMKVLTEAGLISMSEMEAMDRKTLSPPSFLERKGSCDSNCSKTSTASFATAVETMAKPVPEANAGKAEERKKLRKMDSGISMASYNACGNSFGGSSNSMKSRRSRSGSLQADQETGSSKGLFKEPSFGESTTVLEVEETDEARNKDNPKVAIERPSPRRRRSTFPHSSESERLKSQPLGQTFRHLYRTDELATTSPFYLRKAVSSPAIRRNKPCSSHSTSPSRPSTASQVHRDEEAAAYREKMEEISASLAQKYPNDRYHGVFLPFRNEFSHSTDSLSPVRFVAEESIPPATAIAAEAPETGVDELPQTHHVKWMVPPSPRVYTDVWPEPPEHADSSFRQSYNIAWKSLDTLRTEYDKADRRGRMLVSWVRRRARALGCASARDGDFWEEGDDTVTVRRYRLDLPPEDRQDECKTAPLPRRHNLAVAEAQDQASPACGDGGQMVDQSGVGACGERVLTLPVSIESVLYAA